MADEAPQLITAPTDGEDAPATSASASKLKELTDAANLQYSLKSYEKAAEIYSSATELQAELNGEMAPENAELLYLYGRCLFKVAVAKSDVLGGQVAGEKKKSNSNGVKKHNGGPSGENVAASGERLAENIVEAAVEQKDAPKLTAQQEKAPVAQPYFQITGMENWDSDEEEADAEGEGEGEDEDEEDDFATAFEILDVARVLLQRQIEALVDAAGKKASEEGEANLRHLRERLAETHDLQAEIALENERFGDAIPDFRASLALKQDLFPKESEVIAEAHYKLALALEFDSVQRVREAQAESGQQTVMVMKEDIDEKMRKEAANEMESAIESCRLRIAKEEAAVKTLDPEAAKAMEKSIADVKEIVEDMEQRVGHSILDIHYGLTDRSNSCTTFETLSISPASTSLPGPLRYSHRAVSSPNLELVRLRLNRKLALMKQQKMRVILLA
jgi:HAT1-interacting factor 1